MSIKQAQARAILEAAERAADRFDGLGAPMNAYLPHIAKLRQRVLGPVYSVHPDDVGKRLVGPDFNGVVQPVPERFSTEGADGEGR